MWILFSIVGTAFFAVGIYGLSAGAAYTRRWSSPYFVPRLECGIVRFYLANGLFLYCGATFYSLALGVSNILPQAITKFLTDLLPFGLKGDAFFRWFCYWSVGAMVFVAVLGVLMEPFYRRTGR